MQALISNLYALANTVLLEDRIGVMHDRQTRETVAQNLINVLRDFNNESVAMIAQQAIRVYYNIHADRPHESNLDEAWKSLQLLHHRLLMIVGVACALDSNISLSREHGSYLQLPDGEEYQTYVWGFYVHYGDSS